MNITIIGAGNMGGAIARGLAAGPLFSPQEIRVTAHSQKTLDRMAGLAPGIRTTLDNAAAVREADIVVLAVKPWLVKNIIDEIRPELPPGALIVSVAAGITFAELEAMLGTGPERALFRVIPNTAIAIGQSLTLLAARHAGTEQTALVRRIFDTLGESVFIDESKIAAGTALTSCGIAYAFQYIQANIRAAIELGIYPQEAKRMIGQTLRGAVALLEANGSMPDEEINKVCTPGGITIRGLNEMAAQGFDNAVIAALKKAAGK